jgi:branched-chain amino acid transport system substrate-binding protein
MKVLAGRRFTEAKRPVRGVLGLAAGLAALLVSMACASAANQSTTQTPKEVVLGVLMPLSGASSLDGQNSLRGVQLQADVINGRGGIKAMGGAKIKVVSVDATSDPTTAVSAMQQLITNSKPTAVVCCYSSTLTQAVMPVAERNNIPVITSSVADVLTNSNYQYIFDTAALSSQIGNAQIQLSQEIYTAASRPIKKVAVVYEDGTFGSGNAAAQTKQAATNGQQLVLNEAYHAATLTDATPLAAKIKNAAPDAIYSTGYINDSVLLVRALKSNGVTAPIVGAIGGFVDPNFGTTLGAQANGAFAVNVADMTRFPELIKAYQAKYNDKLSATPLFTALMTDIFAEALETKPTTDKTVLAKSMHAHRFTKGLAGEMPGGYVDFGASGRNSAAVVLLQQWQNGDLVTVWPMAAQKAKAIL